MTFTTETISRRNFLTAAGATGALTALGLAGCAPKAAPEASDAASTSASEGEATAASTSADWLGSAPSIAEGDIVETRDTELLIIGAGNAGMAAAATAADLGLDFTLCEKSGSMQRTRHWFGAVNTRYTEEAGAKVDTARLLNELMRYSSCQGDPRVARVWIEESAEMVEWIDPILAAAGMACEFDNDVDHPTGGTEYLVPTIQHYYSGTDATRCCWPTSMSAATMSPTITAWQSLCRTKPGG